jgi:uncharacterized membrane protein
VGIFNLFGKKDAVSELTKVSPYKLSTEWVPYKLYSNRKSSSTLVVRLKNVTNEILLTSVVAELPKQLGFEAVGLSKEREVRVGELPPGEEREVRLEVYSSMNTDPGDYTLNLTAMAHYRDYGHVLNAVKKRVSLEVV